MELTEIGVVCFRDPETMEFTGKTSPIYICDPGGVDMEETARDIARCFDHLHKRIEEDCRRAKEEEERRQKAKAKKKKRAEKKQ